MKAGRTIRAMGVVAAVMLAAVSARAQDAGDFYRGKVVSLYIGFSPGGGYDVYGRLVARHLGRHIPGNPTVVPMNMEGAGSLRLANWLYNVADRDGSVIGTISRGVPFEPILGNSAFAQFDPREFTWIGSANNEISVCAAWERTGMVSVEQLYERELFVGATGPGADDFVFPLLFREILGTQFRLVTGYAGGNDIDFAMERGELDGRCGWSWSSLKSNRQHWLDAEKIHVLLQVGLEKHPDLPHIPLVLDLAKSEADRQILRLFMTRLVLGRPFLAPPGVPEDRAEILRVAFDAMVADPEFLAEAARARLEVSPVSGEAVQHLLEESYTLSPDLLARAHALVN
jgi:tripartite-type tricarboxylate transporter receptor subunit TctC